MTSVFIWKVPGSGKFYWQGPDELDEEIEDKLTPGDRFGCCGPTVRLLQGNALAAMLNTDTDIDM